MNRARLLVDGSLFSVLSGCRESAMKDRSAACLGCSPDEECEFRFIHAGRGGGKISLIANGLDGEKLTGRILFERVLSSIRRTNLT